MPFRAEGNVKSHNQSQLFIIINEPLPRGGHTAGGSHQNLIIASARVDVCAGGHSLIVMKKASHQFAAGNARRGAPPVSMVREKWANRPLAKAYGAISLPPTLREKPRRMGHPRYPPSFGYVGDRVVSRLLCTLLQCLREQRDD